MGKVTITPDKLMDAVKDELTIYHEDVNEKLREITRSSMADLVRTTRATAPVGARGSYKRNIAGDFRGLAKKSRRVSATWYVKAPDYRLTHLLVHPHPTPNGGMTKADPFLENALGEVLPAYEEAVKEAITNG